ncbi:hypothetical protein L1987_61590 [Smallanthus sonchifolius]|uniref:Uncharacterized protein n=1 Tax=Smallanthus sonchifolius TaxID=185202 RepID=A0ACB9C836_9ASTR|nr:hypothetical protein L1987_61590 [Smallanthus sonchifolius]
MPMLVLIFEDDKDPLYHQTPKRSMGGNSGISLVSLSSPLPYIYPHVFYNINPFQIEIGINCRETGFKTKSVNTSGE